MKEVETYITEEQWISPPSETVLRLIYEKEINLCLFRNKMGLSVNEFQNFINDNYSIDLEMASTLSSLLGGSSSFWVDRYKQFYRKLDKSNNLVLNENYNYLKNLSQLRATSLHNLLIDFKISSYEKLIVEYFKIPKILYSKTQMVEPSPVKIANWVRDCELIAEKIIFNTPVPTFSSAKLYDLLDELIVLTKVNSTEKIINQIKTLLLKSGVILITSPSYKGNGVSGFTKNLLKKYRLIVITDRYKNNAAFWFTLLHEIAHCILHSIEIPIIHYSDEEFALASLDTNDIFEEREANDFVENILFPKYLMNELSTNTKSYKAIIQLGVKYDISPALLVAQIHRLKLAPYTYFRKIFRKVEFDKIS